MLSFTILSFLHIYIIKTLLYYIKTIDFTINYISKL